MATTVAPPSSTFSQVFNLDDEGVWEAYTFDFEKTFPDHNRRTPDGTAPACFDGGLALEMTKR